MNAIPLHDAARTLLDVCRARSGGGGEPSQVRDLAIAFSAEYPNDPILAQIVALAAGFSWLRGQAAWVAVAEKIEDLARRLCEVGFRG